MYREMTDKEKLELTQEIIAKLNTNGLSGIIELVEGQKQKYKIEDTEETIITAPTDNNTKTSEENIEISINNTPFEGASIYSKEALPLVEEDLKNNPKVPTEEENISEEIKDNKPKILEKKPNNPWQDSQTVRPGTINFE